VSQEELLLRHYPLLFSLKISALKTCIWNNNSKILPVEVIANSPLKKCQNPKIRLQALNMLSRAPRREGMWDATVCALVAGKALAAASSLDADLSAPNVSVENCALHEEVQLRQKLS
jgi:hypothetical protein